ncbi:mucin-4 isoform B [Alligator mississippiensis]|uniref:Mucin-4 isoform B n=1 Tax=Alligator mississippiensis TaxID=8496 RepID=A0A151MZR8_ALLMI|nr:mucin-4 isoform B [Alligator mississippiensis]
MGTQRRLLWTFVGCWMWILHELGTAFAVPATTEGQLTQDETLGTDEPKPFAAESDVLQGVKLETADRAATSADAGNSPTPFPPGFSYGEANIEITRVPTHLQLLEAHTVSWLPAVFEHDITTRGDGGEDSSGSGPSPGVTAEPSIAEAKTLPRTTNSSRSSLDNGLTTTTPDAEEAAATAFPFPGQISSFSSKVEPDASSSVPAAASRFVGLDKVFVAPVPREGTEEELISAASKAPLSPSAAETELMGAAVEGTTRAGALSRAVPLPTDAGLGMTNSAVGAQEETAVSNADGQNEVDAFTWSPDTSAGKATESLLWSTEDLGDMESSLWSSLQAEAVTGVREPSGETTPSTATSPDEAEGSEGASEMDGTNDAPKATAPEPPQPSSGSRTVLGTSDNTEEMSTVAFGAGEDDAVPAGPADAEEGLYPQASSSTPGPSQPPSDSKMHSGLAAIQGRGDADSLASAASEGTVGDSSPQSETHPVSLDAELSPDSTAQPLPGAWANAGTSLRSPLEDGEAIHAPEGENSGPTSPSEAPTESSFSEAEDAGVSPAPGSPQPTPDAKADVVRITKEGAEVAMSSGLAATETQEAWLSGARGSLPNTGVETSSLAFAGNEEATASITDTQGQTSPSPSGPASGKMPPALQANGDSAAVSHVSAVAAREGLATTPFPLSVTQAREDDTGAGFAQEGTALASAGAGESVADARGQPTTPVPLYPYGAKAKDKEGVGTTFYQEFMTLNSAKPPFIQDVEARIRRYVGKSYSAVWTLKITWVKAPAYPAWRDVTKTNTYQAVLTTDGVKSYVLILYQDGSMQWDYTRRPATNVLIGYSSGDGFYQNDNLTQRPPAAKYRPDQFRGYSTDLRGLRIYKLDSRVRANYRVRCLSWASKQQEPGTWNRDLPPCPCSLQQGESDGRFRRSKGGWLDAQVTMLYTASPNQYGAGVRCLYSKQNKLIDGRQEKYWKYSRQASPFRDQELKLQDWCCNQTGSPPFCALYGQKRPKIGCDGYRPSNLNPAETSSEESGSRSEKRKRNHRTRKFT